MSGVISSISIGSILTSVAGSVASSVIGGAIGGGGGGGASGGAGGGGSGIQSNEQGFYASNAANPYYGVNVSSKTMEGPQPPKSPEMATNEGAGSVNHGRVTTARETPTQADGTADAKQDINNVWADRLSKYLDYNTRSLG